MARTTCPFMPKNLFIASLLAGLVTATPADAQTPSTVPAGVAVIVNNNFQEQSGPQWANLPVTWTPDHHERFLGEFDTTSRVTLRVSDLPRHEWLRIRFDLYVLKSWDGNTVRDPFGNVIGPDLWTASVEDGPTLVLTSFALFTRDGGRQAFPDEYPGGDHPHGTGAVAMNTLGFDFEGREMNAVYHFDLAVPHRSGWVRLNFRSSGPGQALSDESWGLDNFRLEAWPEPPGRDLAPAALEGLAKELAGSDPVRAFRASWSLISAGDRAVPVLHKRLQPPVVDEKQVRKLIPRLDHPSYTVRQATAEELIEMGPGIEPTLRAALKESPSVETRVQIESILAGFEKEGPANPLARRYLRAIRVLEILGSPAALDALKDLADHAPTDTARKAAQAAMDQVKAQGQSSP